MMTLLHKHPVICLLILVCLALLVWSYWGTHAPQTTFYTVRNGKIPAGFDGFRIVQISDLHNARFGKDNQKLLRLLRESQPDLILLTGDLVDSRRTDVEIAVDFVREAVKLAPVCYTPGNHEARIPEHYENLKNQLSGLGVTVLENSSIPYQQGNDTIRLTGLMDPGFGMPWPAVDTEDFQVVLSHRPELLAQYADLGLDLVLTGHAHGGQFRFPFIGGLFAPQQGLLPDYTAGIHTKDSTTMVISRGLGNVPILPRFNNRPEVVVVILESI